MTATTVYYLEMRAPGQLLPGSDAPGLTITEARVKQWPFNRFLYQFVGGPWDWNDKLGWSAQQWQDYAEAADLRTWVGYSEGSPAGYFELQKQAGNEVEIKYFGLTPAFIGQGLGGTLLTAAIEQAWAWGEVQRVWVHTCSLDHPGALANYQARGMTLYRTEQEAG
ncbi:GNAT family N-acetyltransferase [Seongchinamella sediminis]|uniref:GNAT family N-acetyltransferase n=1 Tax=Seongchinamella sediminis TaxID=2283635 RepID=A0A3L7E2B0_9GAMM|nr:GNAT family N-acetyltransferase [Seongchinamella sediminis]RLQ22421.1 GNAT family N-acetyltransferase [Seongchinamella sediminis]